MATTDTKQQLKDLLRELFQLNNTDLDFGIYRIMNIKSKEVENFITKDLDEKVESVKSRILDRQSGDIKAELDEAKAKLEKDFQVNFQQEGDIEAKANQYGQLPLFLEPFNKFKTAKDKLDNLRVAEDTEKSIYNELYRFFERYYEGGDFISKPRAGKNNYMIPYEGEEVKLYWANYDQYYIKTGDNFKNYLFNNQSADPKTFTQIEFRILDADTAMNNNKEEKGRLFVPIEEPFEWIEEERKLLVKFNYRVPTPEEKKVWGDKQSVKTDSKGINQKLAAMVNDAAKKIKDTELLILLGKTKANYKGEAIALFQYHLERYTTVNKFDYFIHKNLKGFLHRELDNFLKSDVLSIAFLDADWKEQEVQESIKNNVLKASAIRDIALVVIEFISELEEFQKRLFEKRKFVVESNYCMTLDRIPASVYDEMIEHLINDKDKNQINDWIDLKFISGNELEADTSKAKGKKKEEPTFDTAKEYLTANNKLVLDTKYLPDNLKWKLLASIENLDESTDGLLINSENFQALNLIMSKYKGKVQSSYIDPPYNTGSDGFAYKDSYPHSSWLTMLSDRLKMAKKIMSERSFIGSSIDDKEYSNLSLLLENIFGSENALNSITIKMSETSGVKMSHVNKRMAKLKEYLICYKKGQSTINPIRISKEDDPVKLEKYLKYYSKIISNYDEEPENWDIIPIKDYMENKGLTTSDDEVKKFKIDNAERIVYRTNNKSFENLDIKKPIAKVISSTGLEYIWWEGKQMLFLADYIAEYIGDLWTDISTINLNKEGGVDLENGKKPESLIYRWFYITSKKGDLTIDFYLGSGTSAAVALKSERKFIGIEMGDYFNTKSLPRLKNVLFGENGGVSKELQWKGHGIFQYLKLEQYEDTLNNIEIHTSAPQLSFLDNIRYQLIHGTKGSDSLINLEKFTKPFNYNMNIVQQNEPKEGTNIDLVTTFNFLLGIDVQRYVLAENNGLEYRVVFGKKGLQQYIIIWRNFDETTVDLKAEKEFITKQVWFSKTSLVFCNGDNAFSAHPIEPEFIRLMNEPVL